MSDAEGASGLRLTEEERETLAVGFATAWADAVNDTEDANFIQTDPESLDVARNYAEMIAPAVERILADRLAAHPPEPEASAPSDLAALLRAHEATNLVNSREHWVECGCGARLHVGEFDDPQTGYPDYDAEYNARAAHVAQVIADTYLPAVVREAEARAWDEGYEAGYRLQQGRPVDRPRRGGL